MASAGEIWWRLEGPGKIKTVPEGMQGIMPPALERERRLRAKTFAFLALMALLGPSSNVMFRAGMKHVGVVGSFAPAALLAYAWRVFTNAFVVSGIVTRILFTVASLLVLSWADYSFVTPVSAINYAIVALMGHYLLGESVSGERWVGIALICIGVGLVSITPTSTAPGKTTPGAGS